MVKWLHLHISDVQLIPQYMQLLDSTPHDLSEQGQLTSEGFLEKSYAAILFTSVDSKKYKTKIIMKKNPVDCLFQEKKIYFFL